MYTYLLYFFIFYVIFILNAEWRNEENVFQYIFLVK